MTYVKLARAIRKLFRVVFPKIMLARARSRLKSWNEVEADLLEIVADRQRDAVDVGAYAGVYTMRLAKLARTVYAFEPDAEMAGMLRRAAPPNVRVSTSAVSSREGTSAFHVPLSNGRRAVVCGSLVAPQGRHCEVRTAKTVTLDAVLADSDVGFIKIDVEGAEQLVLLGARRLLARCRPVILAEANDSKAVATISAFFEQLDYTGFYVYEGKTFGLREYDAKMQKKQQLCAGLPSSQACFANNYFFVPSEAEKELRTEIDRFLALSRPANAG